MKEHAHTQRLSTEPAANNPVNPASVLIPDYELIRKIGSGSFAEVWMARSKATGRYRAVKIVHRACMTQADAYDIEFAGLKRFEEISREHPGFVDILHISRNDESGYFYYVMEMADDLETGQQIKEKSYQPKTLAAVLQKQGRLPASECVQVGLELVESLAALHRHGLVHRDVKPANIIFVRGQPKLADIGLVAQASPNPTEVLIGTPGYLDERVHGSAQGDLFSLGRVLYVMATGRHAKEWPASPAAMETLAEPLDFLDLDRLYHRACHDDPEQRFNTADELREALAPLRTSHALRRLQRLDRWFKAVKRFGLLLVGLLALLFFAGYQWTQTRHQRAELRHRLVGSYVAHGTRAMDDLDLPGSLPWLSEALRLEEGDDLHRETHRLRLTSVLRSAPHLAQMWFNEHEISFATFAGDDDRLFLWGEDGRWTIAEVGTGRTVGPAIGKGRASEEAAISPASGLAVTADSTEVLRLWSLKTGQEIRTFAHATNLSCAAISPDGSLLGAATESGAILVWDAAGGAPARQIEGDAAGILHLSFNHRATRLISSGMGKSAVIWDVATGRKLYTLPHKQWVFHGVFSPDDRLIATASYDRTVRLWRSQDGSEAGPPLAHDDGVYSAEFSADGQRLATACLDFSVRIWDVPTLRLQHWLRHDAKPVHAAFSPSGRRVVSTTYDGTIRVWDLQPTQQAEDQAALQYSADGRWAIQRAGDNVQVLSLCDGKVHLSIPAPRSHWIASILSDQGNKLLMVNALPASSGKGSAEARLWDCSSMAPSPHTIPLSPPFTKLILSPLANRLAVITSNRLEVWNLATGRSTLSLERRFDAAAFDPSGRHLASASDKLVNVWRTSPGSLQFPHSLRHPLPVDSLTWDREGRRLVTTCWDSTFRPGGAWIWDGQTGTQLRGPLAHRDGVRFAVINPAGDMVVTCGEDFAAVLWDPATGQQLTPPLHHKHQVVHASFSQNGRWVATACRDHTARLWDASTGEPITPPLQHTDEVEFAQFLDHDRLLCARNKLGQYRVWRLDADKRSTEELRLWSELLSAQQSGSAENRRPHSKAALQDLWRQLQESTRIRQAQ